MKDYIKEYITGISFSNIILKRGSQRALLFYLEEDGTLLAELDYIYLEAVEEYKAGSYIVKSSSPVNYYLLDCNVSKNSIFYCTDEDEDTLYGTYVGINNGSYDVKYNYRIKKEFGALRLLGKSYISTNDGGSIFVNTDILHRRLKKRVR